MANRFLHVTFDFADGRNHKDELQPIMDKAVDWIRYAPNCWILWTSSTAETWFERFEPIVKGKGEVLILGLDLSESQGWISKSVWEWLRKDGRS